MSIYFLMIAAAYCCRTIIVNAKTVGQSLQREPQRPSPQQGNPRLYFSANDVETLRDQTRNSHAHLYQKLVEVTKAIIGSSRSPPENWEKFTAKWNEVYGNNLAVLATYCVLTPNDHDALNHAKIYMNSLADYPSWRVKGMENDDVPVAHTLLGFATAFDFLHGSFTSVELFLYLSKIRETCEELWIRSITSWWGRSYIHNHVATNYVALLTAAVVVKPYFPDQAAKWEKKSLFFLDNTMKFLNLVVDGSLQEGVSYGSYTLRSLTQFLFLTQRHFNKTYWDNNWVREHFNFLLYSILPGYQKTIGIADSNRDWAYGPESQLTYLESHVYRNGKAIWLANRINRLRPASRMNNGRSNLRSTVHTEFLFYNRSREKIPLNQSQLHVFSDWGVITFGGGTPAGNVFLSFKCGRLHGRAINTLRPNFRRKMQSGFVPGHEQPDHGSFVFIAKEQPVITESFYAPKFSFLENVLMFGPSDNPSCSSPYQGQLGECNMWFDHLDQRTWQANGEIVGYSRHGDVIFMSGDMTGWYDDSLRLQSVYRALVMLSPSVLVVIDTIRLRTPSRTTHVSAFFHNVDLPFEKKTNGPDGLPCALVGRFSMCWVHHNSHTVNTSIQNNFSVKHARYATNFINVTSRFSSSFSSTAYVFHGPQDILEGVNVFQKSDIGLRISLKVNSDDYVITLPCRHDNPRARRTFLGSNGFGRLRMNKTTVIHLGLKSYDDNPTRQAWQKNIKRDEYCGNTSAFFYTALISFVLVFLFIKSKKRLGRRRRVCWSMSALLIVWMVILLAWFSLRHSQFSTATILFLFSEHSAELVQSQLEAVIVTGLPSNGVDIARELFITNTDFVVVDVPSMNVTPSGSLMFEQSLDFCEWNSDFMETSLQENKNKKHFRRWWEKLIKAPFVIRKNGNKDYVSLLNPLNSSTNYRAEVIKSQGAFAAVHFKNAGCLFKVSWMNSGFLRNSLKPVLYIVRDPRSWIEFLLSEDSRKNSFLERLSSALDKNLSYDGCMFPTEISNFKEAYNKNLEPHVILAQLWSAFVCYASKLAGFLPRRRFKIIRLESLISSPKESSEEVYSFLQMPFPAAVEHRILQVTRTGIFKLEDYGFINEKLGSWGKFLTEQQVLEIERICKKAMRKVGYN